MRYSLKTLAPARRGVVQVPAVHSTLAAEAAYLKILRVLLRELARYTRETIIPEVTREMTRDAVGSSLFDNMRRLGRAMAGTLQQRVDDLMALEARRHTAGWMAMVKRSLGVDVSAVVSENDLTELLETVAARNASLITNLSETVVTRVQNTVTQSVLTGRSVKDLRKQLVEDFGFADSRAQLIATDQTAKLNSDLNRFRHQEAGIEKYIWRTAKDERVRSRHRRLDGKIYAYGEPTGAEQGLPPGQPIRCRCVAIAVVEFDAPAKVTPREEVSPTEEKLETAFTTEGTEYATNLVPQKWGKQTKFGSLKEAYDHDMGQRENLIDLMAEYDLGKPEKTVIDLAKLTTYQSTIDKAAVEKIASRFDTDKYNEGDPAQVYLLPDGSYLLRDGNHRVNAAILAGLNELPFLLRKMTK